ncbi:MAG: hypothetical protein QXU67_04035, partial [Candidatus Bathyarchaeia archaeon]
EVEKTPEGREDTKVASRNPYILVAILFIFVGMLFIPFIPSILEIRNPKEDEPLAITMDYTKDPRYFGRSFRRRLSVIPALEEFEEGIKTVRLSKEEIIEIKRAQTIFSGESINHIFYVIGDAFSDNNITFKKEIYVRGKLTIGENNTLRAIACDGDVFLGANTKIIRWLDAEGSIETMNNCDLGISCTCEKALIVDKNCSFNRLYGKPIVTYNYKEAGPELIDKEATYVKAETPDIVRTIEDTALIREGNMTIEPFTTLVKDIVVKGNLYIKRGAAVKASMKVYGETFIESGAQIYGDIFSEGPVKVGEDAVILGDVFSQSAVYIEKGARIGKNGTIKSVIGKKEVRLAENVCIFGYVLTEGKGTVV